MVAERGCDSLDNREKPGIIAGNDTKNHLDLNFVQGK